jgi:hypothetical protein
MATYRCEQRINASPERCYEVFTDLDMASQTIDEIQDVKWVKGDRFEPGARFACTRVMFGKPHTEEMTVEVAEPGRRYVLGSDSCGSRFETTYTFEPDGDGTMVRQTMACTPRTLGARLMTPMSWMMSGAIKKTLRSDMNQLRRACEAGGTPVEGVAAAH